MKMTDIIPMTMADTIPDAFRERVHRSPEDIAYRQFDQATATWHDYSWGTTAEAVERWRRVLAAEPLIKGDRVALLLRNCWEWVLFDQAALSLGLVTVPLFTNDRPDNIAYILEHSDSRMLLIEGDEQWQALAGIHEQLRKMECILTLQPVSESRGLPVIAVADWLQGRNADAGEIDIDPDELATIVYTSGTTGRPKGVMLSHHNILWNASAGLGMIDVYPSDVSLSFLPLSHTLERTVGYYLMMLAGATVAFARSIPLLAEDLVTVRPSILIAVPRIFERIYARIQESLAHESAFAHFMFDKAAAVGLRRFEHHQHREKWDYSLLFWPVLELLVAHKVQARLGGRLRFAISGGAPLSADVAQLFIGLGIPIQQGYGLTEASPIISVNRLDDNIPESIGMALPGVETRIGEDAELLTRSPAVMLGYWKDAEATRAVIDTEGWLHTGDQARIEQGHIYITGRRKEIIVMANGEKIAPADLEMAIALDGLIDQVMVIGEGRPYLSALVVPNPEKLATLMDNLHLESESRHALHSELLHDKLLDAIRARLHDFPGYAEIRRIGILEEPWSVENGLLTPTLKLKRAQVQKRYRRLIDCLYTGH